MNNLIIVLILITNLILIILIRKISRREGGHPSGLHIHSFLKYVYQQSKTSTSNVLKLLVYFQIIIFITSFIVLLFLLSPQEAQEQVLNYKFLRVVETAQLSIMIPAGQYSYFIIMNLVDQSVFFVKKENGKRTGTAFFYLAYKIDRMPSSALCRARCIAALRQQF